MLNTKKVCIFVLNKLNKLKMKSVVILLFLSTTLFSQSGNTSIQSDTNFIYTSQKIILGTSGTTTWIWYNDSTSYTDTIPAIFLITSIDSAWVNVNLTYSSDKPGLLTDLIYIEPNYQKIECLNTMAVRGYIVENSHGFSFREEKYLDKDKKPFPKSAIIWQIKR